MAFPEMALLPCPYLILQFSTVPGPPIQTELFISILKEQWPQEEDKACQPTSEEYIGVHSP